MTLTISLNRLMAYAEESDDFDADAFMPIIDQIKKASWRVKDKDGVLRFPLSRLMVFRSVEFSLWALGAAEQQDAANRIGAQICLCVASNAMDTAIAGDSAFDGIRRELEKQRMEFATAKNCIAVREWVGLRWRAAERVMGDSYFANLSYDVQHLAMHAFTAGVLCATDTDAEFMGRWRLAPATIIQTATNVTKRIDPAYKAARLIADCAEAAQHRWQAGTRLDFDFLEALRELLDETEALAEQKTLPVMRGWAEAAWAEYVGTK